MHVGVDRSPFVGRHDELETLRTLLRAALDGRGGTAFVEGEAGIGKTRLLDVLVEDAQQLGFHVMRGTAHEMERGRPFGALVDCIAGARAQVQGSSQVVATEAVVDIVERVALTRPLVLAVDDLQYADAATLLTIGRLVRRAPTSAVAIVVTARPNPRPPELHALVRRLREDDDTHIVLAPLTSENVDTLIAGRLGAPPGTNLRRHADAAGGNPLYLNELLAAVAREAEVHVEHGLAEMTDASVPPSLRVTIMRALSFVAPETLDVLRLAAVLGSTFDMHDLVTVTGRRAVDLLSALRDALDAHLLTEAESQLSFRHELVRDALYGDVPRSVRSALHTDAARALAHAGAPASQVAAHFRLGAPFGDAEAVAWLAEAAREVVGHDPATAAELLATARDLLPPHEPSRASIGADLVGALTLAGQDDDALALAAELLAVPQSVDVERRVRFTVFEVLGALGRADEGKELLEAFERHPDLEAADRAGIAARRVLLRTQLGDLDGATNDGLEAIAFGRDHGALGAERLGCQYLSMIKAVRGDFDEAIELARRATAPELQDRDHPFLPTGPPTSYLSLGLALIEADRFDDARATLAAARSGPHAVPFVLCVAQYLEGFERFNAGVWDDAVVAIEGGLATSDDFGLPAFRTVGCALLAKIAACRDDLDRVRSVAALVEADMALPGGSDIFGGMWARASIAGALDGADAEGALLGESLSLFSLVGLRAHYRYLAPDHVRLQRAAGNGDAVSSAVALVEDALAHAPDNTSLHAIVLRCRGLADDDAAVLLSAVETYRRAPRPMELAWACEDAGAAFLRAGDGETGVALLREAIDQFERNGAVREIRRARARLRGAGVQLGVRVPRRRATSGWESLTETERKVADLVAEALTNREIGDRLFVSSRTVESHVAHILAKLGLSSRREIARSRPER